MDPYEEYGKPLITLERLHEVIGTIDDEFEGKLRRRYTDAEIQEMTEKLDNSPNRTDENGNSALDLMLLAHRIEPRDLERLMSTMANGVKHSYDAGLPMTRAMIVGMLTAFQIGWLARGEKEELLSMENRLSAKRLLDDDR